MNELVQLLTQKGKTISAMESCTGGAFVDELTNIPGASNVLKFSAVTYSNEYKIKMGVSEDIINAYTVYSSETAKEMALAISKFTNSDYSVGITGKLKAVDPNNLYNDDDKVYIAIYDKDNDVFWENELIVTNDDRKENKSLIVSMVADKLKEII